MDVRQYMYSKGFRWKEARRPSGNNGIMNCPFCQDREKKFAINMETGAFKCNHENKCGVSGSFWEFQKMLGDTPRRLNDDRYVAPVKKPEYKPVKVQAKALSGQILDYLHGRGFKDEIIKQFKLGQNPEGNAVMYPFYRGGKVVNVKYRAIAEKKFWNSEGGEPVLFNRDAAAEGEVLYITEGQDDCIALAHYGIVGVSVPSGVGDQRWIEHEWDYLERFKTIVLMFDNDAAGYEAVQTVANRLGKWRCYQVMLPEKDVNECLIKGIPAEDVIDCILNPIEFGNKQVKSAASFTDEIIAFKENPEMLYGINVGIKGLEKIIRGWRPQEMSVWTGNPGSGKSTLLNMIIINLLGNGEKCMSASLEMPPKSYILWALMQYTGEMEPSRDQIKAAMNDIGHNWYILNYRGEIKEDLLMDAFEFAARKHGVKHFIIDSLMKITLKDADEYKGQKDFAKRLTDFAAEYDCHVHLVAHPRKGQKDTDKPDRVDISGSANVTNMAHNVFALYRFTEDQKATARAKSQPIPDAILTVKKNRAWGSEGTVNFDFVTNCKRFVECI